MPKSETKWYGPEDMATDEPMSLGGDLPVSRRCHGDQHDRCPGGWTQYPDQGGPCQCVCHRPEELEVPITDVGGYLPCGCLGSQPEHTCRDV